MPKFIQTILLLVCFTFATNTQAQIINIPDANFKNYLVLSNSSNHIAKDSNDVYIKIDRNNNNEIEVSEALRVRNLTLNSNITSYIGSIEGINYFSNLQSLDIGPQQIQNINIHGLAGLQYISINNCSSLITANIRGLPALQNMSIVKNRLSTLILDSLPQLTSLHIFKNKLTSFDATSLKKLRDLDCSDNLLTSLNVKGLNNLSSLDCNNNQLVNLDASNLSSLSGLTCSYNQLNNLNMSGSNILSYLSCNNNKLTTLDVSGFNALNSLQCSYNKLSDIFMKNNTSMNSSTSLNFYNNPYLKYVCVDNSDIITVKENLYQDYVYGVVVNSLCSSTLDGTCYSVNCNIRYDNNNDGCSLNDSFFSNIKVVINSNIDTGYLFSDLLGNFTVDLDTGIYTLTPQMPNNYFICTPSSTNITFPEDTILQQFCITTNGIHHDVSVTVIPIRAARPGFSDATYKIVLKNKGNQLESGTIKFIYDENKQDFISASSTPTTIANGELSFAFNLLLFETKEITLTMRTNAPTDNPAVNAGDVLNVQVATTLDNGVRDEYIKDNFKNIKQTVVGSIDPNDKTCLEGKIATPDVIGDFVNYLIRFENTGTANAENVVVTDFIDLAKFDISSLELTSTSHSCKTLISNGNKVQFVFDNINLPYTDPNKYGYVAFKIKTKPTLVIGDSLKNTADIYFDYNLPIKTNTAATRIDNIILSTKNATNKEGSLSVYPNPSTGNFIINFESKGNFPITIKMMDLKGSVVLEKNINHTEKSTLTIDDKNISNGIYLINIHTEKENWLQKLMIVK